MSLDDELKKWESKHSKRKQAAPDLSANQLREKGNELFRSGDFLGAERLYSDSVDLEETIEALSNRALARLKLNKPEAAVADCDRLLLRDPNNVKGLARRGMGRSALGLHSDALKDFILAEQLEPSNKQLRKEREREEAFVQAYRVAAVSLKCDESEGSSDTIIPKSDLSEAAAPVTVPVTVETITDRREAFQNSDMNTVMVNEALKTIASNISLPAKPPQTGYMFEKIWRDLKGHSDLRVQFLTVVLQESDYQKCFSGNIEPALFMEIMRELSGEDLLRVLTYFASLKSFELTKMMVGARQRDEIISRASVELSPRISSLLS